MNNIVTIVLLAALNCAPRYGLVPGAVAEAEVSGNRAVIKPVKGVQITAKRGEWKIATPEDIEAAAQAKEKAAQEEEKAAQGEPEEPEVKPFAEQTKAELVATAKTVGLDLNLGSKAQMIAELEAHLEKVAGDGKEPEGPIGNAGPEGAQGPEGQAGVTEQPEGDGKDLNLEQGNPSA